MLAAPLVRGANRILDPGPRGGDGHAAETGVQIYVEDPRGDAEKVWATGSGQAIRAPESIGCRIERVESAFMPAERAAS